MGLQGHPGGTHKPHFSIKNHLITVLILERQGNTNTARRGENMPGRKKSKYCYMRSF